MLRPGTFASIAATVALVVLSPFRASAGDSLVLSQGDGTLDGDKSYYEVVIQTGRTLSVKRLADQGKGYLHLRAHRIVVEAGALIQANGAGYQGHDLLDGDGPAGGFGLLGAAVGDPGGGGAYGGNGGVGTSFDCVTASPGSVAGAAFPELTFGAAGGAANVAGMGQGSRGGHGGGYVILEASEVQILGTIEAKGEDGRTAPNATGGVGSGGGAGGAVQIITSSFLTDPASTRLVATGGQGGDGTAAKGGGGGGGRILLTAPDAAFTADVAGGLGGAGCALGAGEGGSVEGPTPPAECLDVDGDGASSVLCGGADCDDGDPSIGPASPELCDGIDNDCSGVADDNLAPTACAAPLICDTGACVEPPDAGADAGPVDTRIPVAIDLSGGCNVPAGGASGPLAALFAMTAALLLRGRRRRSPRSSR